MANQTEQLIRLLRGEGLDVSVVNTQAPYRPHWVERVRILRAVFRLLPYIGSLWRAVGRAEVVHVMANSGWAWHLLAAPAICIARMRNRPTIVNYRGGLAPEFLQRSARTVLPLLKSVDLVVPSRFLQGVFSSYGKSSRVVPNIVDLERFHPAASKSPGEQLHLVVPRNLESIYGNDLFLRAVARLRETYPGVKASIAGEGVQRQALESLARELGISSQVVFTGRLRPDEMAALLREASIIVNPSRADNMPNSVLEALASGVPVVSTNVGGLPWLVEHGRTAWLVNPESVEAIVEGVRRVWSDTQLRQRLTAEGRTLAQSCSWPLVRNQWLEAYRAAAG